MWKFPKTYELTISFEHLPMFETQLQEMVLEWETSHFSFLRPFWVLDWKTKPEPLGHSGFSLSLQRELSFFDSIRFFCFPHSFAKEKKDRLTNSLRDKLRGKGITNQSPKEKTSHFEKIQSYFQEPTELRLKDVTTIQASLQLEGMVIPLPMRHIQMHEGNSHLVLRMGLLKTIHYRLHSKTFQPPYPKLAECYIQTRDTHKDKSFGNVYYSFLGYFLEIETDEYLLPYFGLKPTVPQPIRETIPKDIWNAIKDVPKSDWILTSLKAEELEFRPVYQVSTSLPHHLK